MDDDRGLWAIIVAGLIIRGLVDPETGSLELSGLWRSLRNPEECDILFDYRNYFWYPFILFIVTLNLKYLVHLIANISFIVQFCNFYLRPIELVRRLFHIFFFTFFQPLIIHFLIGFSPPATCSLYSGFTSVI